MKITVEIKPEHFEHCIYGDNCCNPVSHAIAERLGVQTFVIRIPLTNVMAPLGYNKVPVDPFLVRLLEMDSYGELTPLIFNLDVPGEWLK